MRYRLPTPPTFSVMVGEGRPSTSCFCLGDTRKTTFVMPGLTPLLSGLGRVDWVQHLGTGGLSAHRSSRGSDRGTPPSRTCPPCHPGLVPGSREAGRERCLAVWTPEQVRGDKGGSGDGLAHRHRARPEIKPDSNGLVPGIHVHPPAHPLPAHAAMPQHVDARNKSGHDGRWLKERPAPTGTNGASAVSAALRYAASPLLRVRVGWFGQHHTLIPSTPRTPFRGRRVGAVSGRDR